MKKTIIYIRTSTEDQEPKNQIKSCENLTKSEYILIQDKQSAFKDNIDREGFNLAKKNIKSGNIEHFIVWDLDRIFRNRKKLKEFFEFCKYYNCSIHSVNQEWLEQLNNIPEPFNEIMHELMLNLMGWLSEDESKKKSERIKLSIRKDKQGNTKSYKGNRWGRKPIHQNKIKYIIDLYNEGLSYSKISKKANISKGKISQIITVHKTFTQKTP